MRSRFSRKRQRDAGDEGCTSGSEVRLLNELSLMLLPPIKHEFGPRMLQVELETPTMGRRKRHSGRLGTSQVISTHTNCSHHNSSLRKAHTKRAAALDARSL